MEETQKGQEAAEGSVTMNGEAFRQEMAQLVGTSQPPVKRTKVAILGFTETWKLAPFNDPTFEIWGLNELYTLIPRYDRWFDIHSRHAYENDKTRTSDHVETLKKMTVPIYMHQHWDDIPMSVPYPLQEMLARFPNPSPNWRSYFNNSISYMLALALVEGFQEIHIYGVDMAADSEYHNQRPSCEYFVGIAQGAGRTVYIPPESDLLKEVWLYGFEQDSAIGFDRKLNGWEADLQSKWNALNNEIAQKTAAREQYAGAIQTAQHMKKNWRSSHQGGNT